MPTVTLKERGRPPLPHSAHQRSGLGLQEAAMVSTPSRDHLFLNPHHHHTPSLPLHGHSLLAHPPHSLHADRDTPLKDARLPLHRTLSPPAYQLTGLFASPEAIPPRHTSQLHRNDSFGNIPRVYESDSESDYAINMPHTHRTGLQRSTFELNEEHAFI